MKNPLELELHKKLKHANKFIFSKQYEKAIQAYSQGLNLYQGNKLYNENISQHYQSLFYSLRGNVYSIHLNSDSAEDDFEHSLKINPFDSLTLIRRAKHFIKKQRYPQAILDIDLALLYDPENLSYFHLFDQIQNKNKQIQDKQLQFHINWLISRIKYRYQSMISTQNSQAQSEKEEEAILNFSKLKKIDRKSNKLSQNHLQKLKNVIEFKDDQIIQYEPDNDTHEQISQQDDHLNYSQKEIQNKIKKQTQQLKQLQQQQEKVRKSQNNHENEQKVILSKSHGKSRHSILRKSLRGSDLGYQDNLFISFQGYKDLKQSQSSILSAMSIKDIDGKVLHHQKQNIKFRPKYNVHTQKFDKQANNSESYKENCYLNLTNLNSKKRKSCLRLSNKHPNNNQEQRNQLYMTMPAKVVHNTSFFHHLLNIDGLYHRKQPDTIIQQKAQTPIKIEYQSSDSEDFEHDIYGGKKQKQILTISEKNQQKSDLLARKFRQKRSILRKDSLLDVSVSSRNSIKKSVNFSQA